MSIKVDHNKDTDVAFVDVCEAPQGVRICVVDVTEAIGFRTQVLARVDEDNQELLGLIIEDYPAFRRELMLKYQTARVKAVLETLVRTLKAGVGIGAHHQLLAH